MFPTLIEIGPLTIHTYGFFIALGFLLALAWSTREARQRGLDPALVQDIGFYAIVAAIVGSRALYVLLNLDYFLANPFQTLMFWKGGLVFLGGVVAVVLTVFIFLRAHEQPILPWADTFMPGLALGQAVGRLGCFAAGCCFGKTCDLPWAVTFDAAGSLAPQGVPLHPTQLYHSLGALLSFVLLLAVKPYFKEPGRLTGVFLLLYPLVRIGVEFFRADFRGEVGPFSVTQIMAAALFLLGLYLTFRPRRSHV